MYQMSGDVLCVFVLNSGLGGKLFQVLARAVSTSGSNSAQFEFGCVVGPGHSLFSDEIVNHQMTKLPLRFSTSATRN